MNAKMRHPVKLVGLIAILVCLLISTVQADLVGLWRFDEGDGNEVGDSSGYGHDGWVYASDFHKGLSGGVEVNNTDPRWITGVDGNALEFGTLPDGSYPDSDNTNWNYVYVPRTDRLDYIGARWSIVCWIKQYVNDPALLTPLGGAGYQRVISCPRYEFELGVPGDMQDYFWPYYPGGATGDFDVGIGTTQSTGTWYHMAIVYDGANLIKYINGSVNGTVPLPNKLLPDNWYGEYLRFGTQTNPVKDYFIGAIDDVAVFSQALTPAEVSAVMNGDFSGPWEKISYEEDKTTFLNDCSFIAQKNTIFMQPGETRKGTSSGVGVPSWNWMVGGTLDDPNLWGLVNAGHIDGNSNSYEYAAYITVDNNLVQPKPGEFNELNKIHKNTKYDFKVRLAGSDANGNVIGIKFYSAEANDPNNLTLLADLNQTISANETWYELETAYTTDGNYVDDVNTFKVECYILEGTGNGRGDAFAWFDYVRIDVNQVYTCDAYYYYKDQDVWYYSEPCDLTSDLIPDCKVDFQDYAVIADSDSNNPEPTAKFGEMLSNPDFYKDFSKVPNSGDYDSDAPTDWTFSPSTGGDANVAGIWNRDRDGLVLFNTQGQPAGGSVVAYIDQNTVLQQTTSTTMLLGQTYYLTAMVAGDASTANPWLSMLQAKLEYDNSGWVEAAEANLILPSHNPIWRVITAEYTADVSAAGKPLRVTFDLAPNPVTSDVNGYALIGSASISTTKPDGLFRDNLLTNGDFEDISSLPEGTLNNDGWADLFVESDGGWVTNVIPDWDTVNVDNPSSIYGLQCMLWAPSPQPAQDRTSAYFDGEIAQKVTAETIQNDTYYLDFIACINSGDWPAGFLPWPVPDPNLVVEVYWTEGDDLSANSGLITTLKAPVTGAISGGGSYEVPYGSWVSAAQNFTPEPSALGKSFYVLAYAEGLYDTPTFTLDEIYLGKDAPIAEPPFNVGAYTCYDLINNLGGTYPEGDMNEDCDVDLEDINLFITEWLAEVSL